MRITVGNVALLLFLGGLIGLDLAVRPALLRELVDRPLLPGFRPSDVLRFTVEDPAQGGAGRTALRRVSGASEGEGEAPTAAQDWRVEQRYDFAAEEFLVEELLAGLARLTTANRAATEAASHARLGVGASGLRVRLSGSQGEVLADLVIGVPSDESGLPAVVHVRRAEEVLVLRAPGLALPSTDPAAWLRTRVLELDPAEAQGLELNWTSRNGAPRALALALGTTGWRRIDAPDDAAVPTAPVLALLEAAALLHLTDVVGGGDEAVAAAGLAPGSEVLELEVTGADGELVSLRIGAALDAETVAVSSSAWGHPWVGALPEESADLLRGALDALWRTVR